LSVLYLNADYNVSYKPPQKYFNFSQQCVLHSYFTEILFLHYFLKYEIIAKLLQII